jgi:gamma-butyrobetaine dioxygenase
MNKFLIYESKRFHYLWLRDNCQCHQCKHDSGQRLHETWLLDVNISILKSEISNDGLKLQWDTPDQHESYYPQDFLLANCYDTPPSSENNTQLWGSGLQMVSYDYAQVLEDDAVKLAWLNDVIKFGIGKLHNVPTQPGTILKVVTQFGFVRYTNYGDLFEVISVEKAENLAFTPLPLSLHTDNPYRDPVPTLQLLHCLVKAEIGGVTALADGFKAAEVLQKEYPKAFKLLSNYKVKFRFSNDDAILEHSGCMIETDKQGQVMAVRINNRSCAPINVPFEMMTDFYEAYQLFVSILHSETCKLTTTLESGELILFDNQRVLHGREIQAVGSRHLQGCYADRDGLKSTAATLAKKNAIENKAVSKNFNLT